MAVIVQEIQTLTRWGEEEYYELLSYNKQILGNLLLFITTENKINICPE